jgi:threonine synthase
LTPLSFQINPEYSADVSAPLRYASGLLCDHLSLDEIRTVSLKEGFRAVELESYRGVNLFLLDETTRMKTGTYKSLDGCISTALSKKLGFKQVAFSSGSNAGSALTEYGVRAGLETFFFCPVTTFYKLDGKLFQSKLAHLIAVEGSDQRVKEASKIFSEIADVPLIPRLEWRLLSSGIRGFFIAETMRNKERGFDWFAQAICAGFGPIGIFQALESLANAAAIPRSWIPRFLGIQQAGLSPIATAWADGLSQLKEPNATWSESSIEPGLYNTNPSQTYPLLYEILNRAGGDVITVRQADFPSYLEKFVDLLDKAHITLMAIERGGKKEYLERAGLLAGAGMLKAIDDGTVRVGETVLCSLSGGTRIQPPAPVSPEFHVREDAPLKQQVEDYVKQVHSHAKAAPGNIVWTGNESTF